MNAALEEKLETIATEWPYRNATIQEDFAVIRREALTYKRLYERVSSQLQSMRKEVADAVKRNEQSESMIGSLLTRCDNLTTKIDEISKRVDKASEVVTGLRRDMKQPA